nr:MAG TPA: hypothetical protein [Caudoviricetes sp.]
MRRPCSAPAAGASSSHSSTASRRRAGQPSRSSTIPIASRRSRALSRRPKRLPTIPKRGCVSRPQSCVCSRTFSTWCPLPSVAKSRTRVRCQRSSSRSRTLAQTTFTTSEMKP